MVYLEHVTCARLIVNAPCPSLSGRRYHHRLSLFPLCLWSVIPPLSGLVGSMVMVVVVVRRFPQFVVSPEVLLLAAC